MSSPKFICWGPKPQCYSIWKRDLLEALGLMWCWYSQIEIVPIMKKKEKAFFLYDNTQRILIWAHSKMAVVRKPGIWPPTTTSAITSILGFLASITVRNKCILFESFSLWYFVVAAQEDQHRLIIKNKRGIPRSKSSPSRAPEDCES